MVRTKKTTKKPQVKASKKVKNNKVDYYPNRMTFYISFVSVIILFVIAILITVNIYS